jgi:UDP-glucose 4-epimerase
MAHTKRKRILLVGAASGMAKVLAPELVRDYEIFGIDSREYRGAEPFCGEFLRVGYTHRKLADIFRKLKFDALVHVGRISSLSEISRKSRFEQNVYGTANILHLGVTHGIKKMVILSTHLVYGAAQDMPCYLREDDPLRASEGYAELFDAIELDLETRAFIYEHRGVKTILLRPAHIVGDVSRFVLSSMLQKKYFPTLLGYDPLIQIIHERDVVRALILCLHEPLFGVFNVAGEGVLPLSRALKIVGTIPVPLISWSIPAIEFFMNLSAQRFPRHLVNYLKYPTIISDQKFRQALNWKPQFNLVQTLEQLKT